MNKNGLLKAVDNVMGKTFALSLTRNYVSRWGAVEAIRELIQNALDSESPFVYEFIESGEGLGLKLNSEFTVLTPQTLLLGATSKAGSDTAIGSFGEGYKIALLVLTREGYHTEVLNGDMIWRPTFRLSRTFDEEVLHIDQYVSPTRDNKGLTFVIWGVEDIKDEIIKSCLKMQRDIGEVKHTSFGDILIDQPGLLYVGGLFICMTDLKFGYNIKPGKVTLERDRQTVSSWDLKDVTKNMWLEVGDMDLVAQMVHDETPDVEYVRYGAPELVKDACYKLFKEKHPGHLIASSASEMQDMVRRGMTQVVYVGGSMYDVVSKSKGYAQDKASLYIKQTTPHEQLSAWFSANRGEMRTKAIVSFKELLETAKAWK